MEPKRKMRIRVWVDPDEIVRVTHVFSTNMVGRCVLCGALGRLEPRYGLPHDPSVSTNGVLTHLFDCQYNDLLSPKGKLKRTKIK